MKKLVIYMPAFNEGETIHKVLQSVPKEIMGFSERELLVINDGSSDNTESEALKAGATVINHKYNRGVGNAFQTALNYALKSNTDILVSIDADGQFDVNQIEAMIAPIINNEADFCIGNRFDEKRPDKMPRTKYWGNRQISRIVSMVGNTRVRDASCGFRAYSKDSMLSLNLQGSFTYTHETILDLLDKGHRLAEVPVKVTYFDGRVSRVANNLFKYAIKTSVIIFKCLKDYKPLPFFLSIAMFFVLIALGMGGFVLIHWISNGVITPYKSFGIIALALLGMSVVLITLAFLGDLLHRVRHNQEKILYLLKKNYFEQD